jgi:hypothetical protein
MTKKPHQILIPVKRLSYHWSQHGVKKNWSVWSNKNIEKEQNWGKG